MSEESDHDRLLNDILAEPGEAGELRDLLLNRTLRQVRGRRTFRWLRRTGAALLLAPALVLLLWRVHWPQGPEAVYRPGQYLLVRTHRLPQSALIETQPFAAVRLVDSAASLKIARVATHPEDPGYREIDDAALLALAGTNAAVLVRLGPHSAELVFVPQDLAIQHPD